MAAVSGSDAPEKTRRENLPGLLGAMTKRHRGERSALRARQRVERRALERRVKAGR